jgi:hypothetical protein
MEPKAVLSAIAGAVPQDLAMWLLLFTAVAVLTSIILTRYRTGLRSIPGLFLASISNLDQL